MQHCNNERRCGHCKSLAPHWKAAAEELAVAGVPVTLAMIDADANRLGLVCLAVPCKSVTLCRRDAGQEYGVQGFPTIKFFRDGVSSDYNGPRETEGIVTYSPCRPNLWIVLFWFSFSPAF